MEANKMENEHEKCNTIRRFRLFELVEMDKSIATEMIVNAIIK